MTAACLVTFESDLSATTISGVGNWLYYHRVLLTVGNGTAYSPIARGYARMSVDHRGGRGIWQELDS